MSPDHVQHGHEPVPPADPAHVRDHRAAPGRPAATTPRAVRVHRDRLEPRPSQPLTPSKALQMASREPVADDVDVLERLVGAWLAPPADEPDVSTSTVGPSAAVPPLAASLVAASPLVDAPVPAVPAPPPAAPPVATVTAPAGHDDDAGEAAVRTDDGAPEPTAPAPRPWWRRLRPTLPAALRRPRRGRAQAAAGCAWCGSPVQPCPLGHRARG